MAGGAYAYKLVRTITMSLSADACRVATRCFMLSGHPKNLLEGRYEQQADMSDWWLGGLLCVPNSWLVTRESKQ